MRSLVKGMANPAQARLEKQAIRGYTAPGMEPAAVVTMESRPAVAPFEKRYVKASITCFAL